jgi:hypothetical protein
VGAASCLVYLHTFRSGGPRRSRIGSIYSRLASEEACRQIFCLHTQFTIWYRDVDLETSEVVNKHVRSFASSSSLRRYSHHVQDDGSPFGCASQGTAAVARCCSAGRHSRDRTDASELHGNTPPLYDSRVRTGNMLHLWSTVTSRNVHARTAVANDTARLAVTRSETVAHVQNEQGRSCHLQ